MKKNDDYRKRCYDSYISTQWKFTHSSGNIREYDFYSRIAKKRYKNVLPDNKKARLIDIACGAGHFLYFLHKEGYVGASGIDMSEEMLETAKGAGLANLEKADLFTYLPEHKNTFDIIVANDIIEHLRRDEVFTFLDLIYDSLKADGMVLISTLNAQSLFGSKTVYIDFTHELGFTPASFAQVLRVSNFKKVKIYPEKPVIHDLRSALRAALWRIAEQCLRAFIVVESGTGRGFWKKNKILTPRMFATGRKM